jgi:protein-serine/threonine kinase
MQYCAGGDFYDIIKKQPNHCLTESQVQFYSSCVLVALEYLHFNGIIYRDLKPENILMCGTGHIMLTDFDLSVYTNSKSNLKLVERPYTHLNGVCTEPIIISNKLYGTPHYMAPEIIEGKSYGPIIDWWSFGILIFEMLHGFPPFEGDKVTDIFRSVCECSLKFPNKLSYQLKDLIKRLLEHVPEKRLGYKGGSTDIKDHPFFKDIEFQLLKNQTPPIIPSTIIPYFIPFEDEIKNVIDPKTLKKDNVWRVFCNKIN